MYLHGGVYLDLDMYVIRPIPLSFHNVLGLESAKMVNGAIMIFDKQSPFMAKAFTEAIKTHRPTIWPSIGPELLTRLTKSNKQVNVLPRHAFYPYDWYATAKCFVNTTDQRNFTKSYAVHLNTKVTSGYTKLRPGTVCADLLTKFCIFCDEDYMIAS